MIGAFSLGQSMYTSSRDQLQPFAGSSLVDLLLTLFSLVAQVISFFLLLAMFAINGEAMYYYSNDSSSGNATFMLSPRIKFCSPPSTAYPLIGEALFLDKLDSNANYSGKVIIYRIPNFNFVEDSIEALVGTGVLALVSISWHNPPGITQYERARYHLPPITFPVFEIAPDQNDTFASLNNDSFPLTVKFVEDEANPWDYLYLVEFPALSACILFTAGIVAVIATFKLTNLILRDGIRANLAQIVLALNLVGMLIRCMWSAVDPLGSYGIYVYAWVQVGITLPTPFCLGGALVIALYWHQMLSQFGHPINGFLGRMFIPFLIIGALSLTLEIATCAVRAVGGPSAALFLIDALIYAVIILSLFIIFMLTSYRLEKTFEKLNARLNQHQKKLRVVNRMVVAVGVFLVLELAFLIIVGSGSFFWLIPVHMVAATGVLGCLNLISFFQVLIIRAPEPYWFTYCKARLTCSSPEEAHHSASLTAYSTKGASPVPSETGPSPRSSV